ncbi:hypothetical protein XELAEV_18039003mg [Xenopus laevis]|uniref:Uncharacterized protein n=1 Tax=Xenopus laevis TaxID=8355 RepID=A0A974C7W3_XENLA|nr:hypothetical protein XELAEV_18039003mg [Xenopus laevis]
MDRNVFCYFERLVAAYNRSSNMRRKSTCFGQLYTDSRDVLLCRQEHVHKWTRPYTVQNMYPLLHRLLEMQLSSKTTTVFTSITPQ